MRKLTVFLISTTVLMALPAHAQQMPAAADEAEESADVITVFGKGETRQVQEIQAVDIARFQPVSGN